MSLVVEDGTGLASAESYIGVADASTYALARGLSFPITDAALAEQALRRATTWLDGHFRGQYLGWKKLGRRQALEWPRNGAYVQDDPYGTISNAEVPVEVRNATVEAAVREYASPGSLSPDVIPGQIKKSVSISGAIAVTYAVGAEGAQGQRPVMTVVGGILAPVLGGRSGSSIFGWAQRG